MAAIRHLQKLLNSSRMLIRAFPSLVRGPMPGLPCILKRPFGITGPIQGPPYRVPRIALFRGGEIAWSIAIFKPAAPLCMGTVPAAETVRHVIPAGGVCPNDRGRTKSDGSVIVLTLGAAGAPELCRPPMASAGTRQNARVCIVPRVHPGKLVKAADMKAYSISHTSSRSTPEHQSSDFSGTR